MIWGVFSIGLIFILVAAIIGLWSKASSLDQEMGLPAGDVIYTDAGTWFPNEKALFAADIQLTGKPDYLVKQSNGMIIPVELKSGRAPDSPWPSHLYQLAAYCFLVEATYGTRPDYGIIQYQDRAFAVDYTDTLEDDFLDLIEEMRFDMKQPEIHRDHNEVQLCTACSVNQNCSQSLHSRFRA